MKNTPSESEIQKQILKLIRSKGILCERINSGLARVGRAFIHLATKGHPDIVCYLGGGKVLFIEVKSAVGKVNPEQETYHRHLRLLGHQVEVVRDIQHAESLLTALGY